MSPGGTRRGAQKGDAPTLSPVPASCTMRPRARWARRDRQGPPARRADTAMLVSRGALRARLSSRFSAIVSLLPRTFRERPAEQAAEGRRPPVAPRGRRAQARRAVPRQGRTREGRRPTGCFSGCPGVTGEPPGLCAKPGDPSGPSLRSHPSSRGCSPPPPQGPV